MKTQSLACVLLLFGLSVRAAETATFVLGVWPDWTAHTNAFLVTLSDPQQISYARVLVATGGTCKDLDRCYDPDPAFTIQVGADGTNRNVALPGQPAWSWHVTGIVSWGMNVMFDAPYCYPWQLEQAIQASALSGQITNGFYSTYNFVAEVNPELRLYQHAGAWGDLALYWTHHVAGLTYDIDYTSSLAPADWHPLGINRIPPSADVLVGPWRVSYTAPGVCALSPISDGRAYFRLRAQP